MSTSYLDPRLVRVASAFFASRSPELSPVPPPAILAGTYQGYDGSTVRRHGQSLRPRWVLRVLDRAVSSIDEVADAWEGSPTEAGISMEPEAVVPTPLDPIPSAPTDAVPPDPLDAGLLAANSYAGVVHACFDCKHWSLVDRIREADVAESWRARRLDEGRRAASSCGSKRHFDRIHVDTRITMGFGHWAGDTLISLFDAMAGDGDAWDALVSTLVAWFEDEHGHWQVARDDAGLDDASVGAASVEELLRHTVREPQWVHLFSKRATPKAEDDETDEQRRAREAEAAEVAEHNARRHPRFDGLGWLAAGAGMATALRTRAVARFQVRRWCTSNPVAKGVEKAQMHDVRTPGGIAASISAVSSGSTSIYSELDEENSEWSEGSTITQYLGRVEVFGRTLSWSEIDEDLVLDADALAAEPESFLQDWRALLVWIYYVYAKSDGDRDDEVRSRMAAIWHQWYAQTWGPVPATAGEFPSQHLGVHMDRLATGAEFLRGFEGPWFELDDDGQPLESSASGEPEHGFDSTRFEEHFLLATPRAEDSSVSEVQLVQGELYALARLPDGAPTDEGQPICEVLWHLALDPDDALVSTPIVRWALPPVEQATQRYCFFAAEAGLEPLEVEAPSEHRLVEHDAVDDAG